VLLRRWHRPLIPFYLVLGWIGAAWSEPLLERLGPDGVALLVAGRLAYACGLIFFTWRRLPFHKPIWHGFAAAGGATHVVALADAVVPLAR
jgi:hemolysin III